MQLEVSFVRRPHSSFALHRFHFNEFATNPSLLLLTSYVASARAGGQQWDLRTQSAELVVESKRCSANTMFSFRSATEIFNAIVGKRSRVRSPWTNAKVCSFNSVDDEFCTKLNFRQWQRATETSVKLYKKMCSLCFETAAAEKPVWCLEKICLVLPPVLHEMQVSAIFRKWRTKENLEKEISIDERLLQQRSRVAWLLNVQ